MANLPVLSYQSLFIIVHLCSDQTTSCKFHTCFILHHSSNISRYPIEYRQKKTQQKSGQETHMRWENDSSSEFFWHSQHSYETWPIEIDHQEQLIIYHHLKWWFSIATSLLSENHQRLPIVYSSYFPYLHMGMGQNLVPLVNIKIAGK